MRVSLVDQILREFVSLVDQIKRIRIRLVAH